jgi:hypothetical protein
MAKKTKEEIDKEFDEELMKLNQLLMLGTDSGIQDFVDPDKALDAKQAEIQDNINLVKGLQGLKDWESKEPVDPNQAELVDLFKKYADINKDSVEVNLPDDLMNSDVSDIRETDTPSMNDLRIWEITNKYRPGYGYRSGIASLDTDTSFVGQPLSVPEPEEKEDPVDKKIKEVTNELNKQEAIQIAKTQADYKALAQKNDALWQYAVYRAANGDASLFDKLVGDAEARKQKRMDQEFQAAENEKNRQSQAANTANTRNEEKLAAFKSARTKAERALQDLNDINDAVRAKWKTGNDKNAAEDALSLRRAYRAYQYALDDAEAAARKVNEAYDSNDIFAKTTGDMGIDLNALKSLDFNGLYTGERNIPYTATMASAKVNSKEVSDALNSSDPNKAREVAAMLGDELERFNTNANPAMSLEEVQRIQNLFKDKIDQLNGVKAPTKNQKRRSNLNKAAEDEQLAWEELQPKLNKETDNAKKQEMVNKHNQTYGSNRTLIKPRKNK